ncbi:MAG: hypothetical protein KF819_15530 [Labilithrix sp.]|nr:hypothetical protein [Labilithrix sp.]
MKQLRSLLVAIAACACSKAPPSVDAGEAIASPVVKRAPSAAIVETDASFVSAAGALGAGESAGTAPDDAGATNEEDASAPRPAFRRARLDPAELAKIFAEIPELARIGSEIRYFNEGDVRAMKEKSSTPHEGITFVTAPIFWSPQAGVELLVAAGRGKNMSFVVALWAEGERYRIASSFLMLADLSPVALAYDATRRRELRWTSCWGCPGEQGFVSYRPEERKVVIVQQ